MGKRRSREEIERAELMAKLEESAKVKPFREPSTWLERAERRSAMKRMLREVMGAPATGKLLEFRRLE